VSHPTPLHPDADLAVVLDDMRQSVAAWGDEGMVMRVFRASICLMLIGILDTLIDLLADFRAGRLPPVLPAYDERDAPAQRETPAPRHPDARHARRSNGARTRAAREIRIADPEPGAIPAPLPLGMSLAPIHLPIRRRERVTRDVPRHPSSVPRAPVQKIGVWAPPPSHAHFVTVSKHSAIP
jgi:hypothetical protein